MKRATSKLPKIISAVIMSLTLCFTMPGIADTSTDQTKNSKQSQNNTLPLKEVKRFTAAISLIESYYVNSIPIQTLFENALRGMLEGLDPHSDYLDEEDFRELTSTTAGEFAGIGIEVTMEQGVLKVISPIDGTPAANAGLKSGDYIIRLDNIPVQGMSLKKAIEQMRGKKGTILNIVVLRKGEKMPLTFSIVRDIIQIQSVQSKMLGNGYGYIRLTEFQEPSADKIRSAITSLQKQSNGQLKGLILDLRNNPGGLLDSSIEIADIFLDSNKMGKNKMIVYTEGRVAGSHFVANATPGDMLNGVPIVVLINQGSASAAEILAGSLRDHKRAILVGAKTFGKGSVQTVLPLDETTGIKMTTALYYTPLGTSIQARGIKPDIIVGEMKIAKVKNSIDELANLSENDLIGHLSNDTQVSAKDTSQNSANTENLMYTDYQLYEALNILKSVVVAEKLQ